MHHRCAVTLVSCLLACGGGDDGQGATEGNAVTTAGGTESGSASGSTSTSTGADDGGAAAACAQAGLVWHTANKTTYESYPDPGSDECVIYNGCEYLGEFAACENTMPKSWVMAHDIAAVFPLGDLALHRLCVRAGDHVRVVTVVDTCGDSDCDGCCTQNRGDADALIDLESFTDARFGIEDGPIEWADLGPGDPGFDGCN